MTQEKVVRIIDYERRSRTADACAQERGQCEADVILMPGVRIEQDRREGIYWPWRPEIFA